MKETIFVARSDDCRVHLIGLGCCRRLIVTVQQLGNYNKTKTEKKKNKKKWGGKDY